MGCMNAGSVPSSWPSKCCSRRLWCSNNEYEVMGINRNISEKSIHTDCKSLFPKRYKITLTNKRIQIKKKYIKWCCSSHDDAVNAMPLTTFVTRYGSVGLDLNDRPTSGDIEKCDGQWWFLQQAGVCVCGAPSHKCCYQQTFVEVGCESRPIPCCHFVNHKSLFSHNIWGMSCLSVHPLEHDECACVCLETYHNNRPNTL